MPGRASSGEVEDSLGGGVCPGWQTPSRRWGAYLVHLPSLSGCPVFPKYHRASSGVSPLQKGKSGLQGTPDGYPPGFCLKFSKIGFLLRETGCVVSQRKSRRDWDSLPLWIWRRPGDGACPEVEEKQKLRRGFVRVYGVLPGVVLLCFSLRGLHHKDRDFSPHIHSKFLLFREPVYPPPSVGF